MLIKALKSFVGEVNMSIDEVKEVTNEKLAQALIDAGMAEKAKAKDLKDKLKNKKGKETEELNDVDEDANKPLEEPPKEDDEPSTEGEEKPVEETTEEENTEPVKEK